MSDSGAGAAANGLIVYVPGLNESVDACRPLLDQLRTAPELSGYAELVFRRHISTLSRAALAERAHELAVAINAYWLSVGRPQRVTLMGHSIGGLLVRYAYLDAAGGFGATPDEWTAVVERIVLFAAPNRGYSPQRLPWYQRWLLSTALALPALTRGFAGTDAVVGAPFITNLRIEWIRQFHAMANPPLVVQVLGTEDSAVSRADSQDVEAMPNSAAVEIPYADHDSIIEPTAPDEDASGEQFQLIASAVYGTPSPPPEATPVAGAQAGITDVVFVLHGIRADAYGWVQSLNGILAGRPGFIIDHPSYGYLPAFNFALPFGHDRQLRLFGDWYTQMLSAYPAAAFHFVGHSNGTYILGRSLTQVPTMRFDRVYLAGSVLARTYDWANHPKQVSTLVNSCGGSDIPVGILCSALRGLGRRDLGVAGFSGFDDPPPGDQFVTLRGGHGAGLANDRLPAVAEYVATGATPVRTPTAWTTAPAKFLFALLSRAMPMLAIVFVVAVVTGLIIAGLSSTFALLLSLAGLAAVALVLRIL